MNRLENKLGKILTFTIITSLTFITLYFMQCIFVYNQYFQTGNERVLINFFTYLITFASGIVFAIVSQIFNTEKVKVAPRIVFIIFYIIAELFVCYLVRGYDLPKVLLFITPVQYVLQSMLFEYFTYHDNFVNLWEDKSGKQLREYLYHNNMQAQDLAQKEKGVQLELTGISIFVFLVVLLMGVNKYHMGIIFVLLLFIFYVSVFLFFYVMKYFEKEAYFANIGFTQLIDDKKSYFKYVCAMFIFATLIGIVCSSNSALIKLKFNQTVTVKQNDAPPPPAPEMNIDYLNDVKTQLEKMYGNQGPNPIVELILQILKWALIIFAAGSVLIFLIRPFLSTGWKNFWKEHKLYKFFNKLLQDIQELILFIFTGKKKKVYATVQAKKFREVVNDFLRKTNKSKEKKAELDRLTKLFMSLINWGEKHGIDYQKNMAPAEYTLLIENFFINNKDEYNPESIKNVHTAGELFEKALYDKELLSVEEEKQYINAVTNII